MLHIVNMERFPAPAALNVDTLLVSGVGLILAFNLPWTRISFGGVEIEQQYQEEIEECVLELGKLSKELQEHEKDNTDKTNRMKLVKKFLAKYSTWGFTISRILAWGPSQEGFKDLEKMNRTELRRVLAELVRDGTVRTRLSKRGNLLYQMA